MPRRPSLPALLAVQLGVSIVTLDISLTSTALPALARGVGADPVSTIWIVNGYFLAVIASLLPLAALGEIHGHRRVFFGGLALFALGALASGLATSLPMLAAARVVVGIGSAAVSATTPALIRTLYPPERLGRGLGHYALVVGVALSVGPTAASAILAIAPWPFLFWTSVPLALLAVALAWRSLPGTELNVRPFDHLSALLCALFFAGLLLALSGFAHRAGWMLVLSSLLVAGLSGAWLLRRETGHPAPMLGVDLFRIRLFRLSSITSACAFAIQGLIFVVLPFLFQFQMGYSQVEAGFLITPWPVTLAVMTLIAAPMADRVSPGLLGGVGLILVALGLVALATMPASAGILGVTWRLVLCGVGFGFFQSPNMKALMSSAPRHRSGSAGGILAASRQIGQSVGAATVAICFSLRPEDGAQAAIWAACGIALLASSVSFLRLLPGR